MIAQLLLTDVHGDGGRLSQTIFEARSRNSEELQTHRGAGGGKTK